MDVPLGWQVSMDITEFIIGFFYFFLLLNIVIISVAYLFIVLQNVISKKSIPVWYFVTLYIIFSC